MTEEVRINQKKKIEKMAWDGGDQHGLNPEIF